MAGGRSPPCSAGARPWWRGAGRRISFRGEEPTMWTMKFLKSHWLGPWLVGGLCALVLLTSAAPPKADAATMAEYGLLLALIAVVCIGALFEAPPGQVVRNQLQAAVEGARLARSEGDQHKEVGRLSKAIGAAEALMGMTSSCDGCDELRGGLQQIIGQLTLFKSEALGVSGTCNPNGVVQGNEQCDPLAVPTGCPTNTLEVRFCNVEC